MILSFRRPSAAVVALSICLLTAVTQHCGGVVKAFSVAPRTTNTRIATNARSSTSTATQTFLVPPSVEHIDTIHAAFQHGVDVLASYNHHGGGFDSSALSASQMLADAAAATVDAMSDAAGDVVEEGGLKGAWMSYLRIFENTLRAVHSTIDGPLRSIGFDQTWGVSIFIFTAMIRSLLIPVSIQQSKNAEYTKALRPYIKQIQEKFKDNDDAKNRAIGKLYEDTEQNPLAGCFTSLLQLPVFLGLYRGVRLLAMDGELKEPFLFLPSLEGPVSAPTYRGLDWLTDGWHASTSGGFPYEPPMGWEATLPFLIMPVILVLLQSSTMKVLSPPMDENMSPEEKETFEKSQGILKFLPLMIGFFSLQVPAGLTIYWFTSNIFTLAQSLAVRTYFKANPPKIELPEYWDAALSGEKDFKDMTAEERRQAVQAGIRVGPTFEELEEEAKFHTLIERDVSLRTDSEAWKSVVQGMVSASVATELEQWVKEAPTTVNGASASHEEKKPFYATTESTSNASQAVRA